MIKYQTIEGCFDPMSKGFPGSLNQTVSEFSHPPIRSGGLSKGARCIGPLRNMFAKMGGADPSPVSIDRSRSTLDEARQALQQSRQDLEQVVGDSIAMLKGFRQFSFQVQRSANCHAPSLSRAIWRQDTSSPEINLVTANDQVAIASEASLVRSPVGRHRRSIHPRGLFLLRNACSTQECVPQTTAGSKAKTGTHPCHSSCQR